MFEQFPYANFHEMNMDWVIKVVKNFLDKYEYIEELIKTGKEDIVNLTAEEMQALTNKKEELENLLQAWYDSHSEDIARELNRAISAFNTAADNKARQTLESIPDDYTSLANDITDLKNALSGPFATVQSKNLFDGVFDESGYIDPNTGENKTGDSYKRTSRYYPIINDTEYYLLNIRLTQTVAPFTVVLYSSESTTPIGSVSCNNALVQQRSIPENATRFRVYTETSFSGDVYIGMTYSESIIPYGDIYEFNENVVPYAALQEDMKNMTNLVSDDDILDRTYLNKTNGSIYPNIDQYRASDFIKISRNLVYLIGAVNAANAPSVEYNAITTCFYDSDKTFIQGSSSYSSGYTLENATREQGMIQVTAPSNAAFIRIGMNDSDNHKKWYLSKYTNTVKYSEKAAILNKYIDASKDLNGKNIAVFGDSIMGNTRDETSTPAFISKATGATVYNFGFGGCRMSVHEAGWDNCSMYRLADDIYNENFTDLLNAINTGWSGMPSYFKTTATFLSECNFDTVDAIIIAYGTNDYRASSSVLDNPDNKFDVATVCGALRYSIRWIQVKHPHIQILVTCPIFRTFFQEGTTTPDEYSDTKNWGSGTLLQYAEAYKQACKDMNVPFLDLYHETGFNPYTRLYFYPADEGTHPNEKGRERIGNIIGGKLKTLLPNN